MLKWFKKRSLLEEMAGVEEQPSLPPSQPTRPPPPPTPPKKACPKCGTFDCISLEEYQRRIKISGAGVLSVSPTDLLQSCGVRQQLNTMKEIEKEHPGIWGKPYGRDVKVKLTKSTGPK